MEHEKHHKPQQQAQLGAWLHSLELGRKVFRASGWKICTCRVGAGLCAWSRACPYAWNSSCVNKLEKIKHSSVINQSIPSLAPDLLEYLLLFLVENLFVQQSLAKKQGKVICQSHPWDSWKIQGAEHCETPEFPQILCQEAVWKHLAALHQPFPHT